MSMTGERARRWIVESALPLWSGAGIDREGFGVWEALDHRGAPLSAMDKRFRVTLRQAFVFAKAEGWFSAGTGDLALDLFDQAERLAFGEDPGAALPGLVNPRGEVLNRPHDLYDIAFFILADAAMAPLGRAPSPLLRPALDRLKVPRGWREALGGAADRRRQNPHMHLFEASVAQVEAGREDWRPVAEECLGLFREVFLQPDHRVFEFFTGDWRPVAEGQGVEPGHMAEWVFLLEWSAVALGAPHGVDTGTLLTKAMSWRGADGLLPDAVSPETPTRRFWPQTELLKAALAREDAAVRAGDAADRALADDVAGRIMDRYLATDVPGGWFDRFDAEGRLLSDNMPASTGYHIIPALRMYAAARSGAPVFGA